MALISLDDGNALFEFVVRKGNGVKGLVDSGLAKVPGNYVQPPEERISKLTAASNQQVAIDFSELNGPNCDSVATAIARAAETLGFFQLVNHGVPLELLEALKDAAHKFFGQPPVSKAVYLKEHSPSPLVINIGDTLQVLSNGRYRSAEHRVRTTSTQSRVSVPIFTMPRPSEKIGPLPELVERDGIAHYREYMFEEYMANFFGKAHEGKKSLEFAETKSHF